MKPSPARLFAVATIALLGLSACSSEPAAGLDLGGREDLVNTLATNEAERDCMLEVIDGYSQDELEAIGDDANNGDAAEQAAANEALSKFEADLAACRE